MTFPDVHVDAAFGYGPFQAGKSWTSLNTLCVMGDTKRGRIQRVGQVTGEATFSFVDPTRSLDPTNPASPYAGNLLPMTPIRVVVFYAGVTYYKFYGFVEEWPVRLVGPFDQEYDVKAVDERGVLGFIPTPSSVWALEVEASAPSSWWRLGDLASSSVAVDGVSHADGTYRGCTKEVAGGVAGDTDRAVTLQGAVSSSPYAGDQVTLGAGVNGTEDFTFAFAYKLNVTQCGFTAVSQEHYGWSVSISQEALPGGRFRTEVYFVVGSGAYNYVYTRMVADAPFGTANDWHICFLRRQGNVVSLTIDGVGYFNLGGTGVTAASIDAGSIFLQGNPLLSPSYTTGPIGFDEAVLWRRKLSDAEVATLSAAYRTPWASERAGARIVRLLDRAGSTSPRNINTGLSRFQPATSLGGSNIQAQIDRVADNEAGRFFFAGDGTATFHDRYRDLLAPGSAVKFTLGPDAGQIHYLDGVQPVIDLSELCNHAAMTRVGGQEQTADDAASRTRYGLRTPASANRSDLDLVDDAEVRGRAQHAVQRFATPLLRVPKVTITPSNTDPATHFPVCLGVELGDRVTFTARPMGSATAYTADQIVEEIHDTFEPGADVPWRTELGLVGADPNSYWRWGVSTWGVSTRWAF